MSDKPTSPLRPPRIKQPELGRWLKSRIGTVCDIWIARVHTHPPTASGQPLKPPSEAQLRRIYTALCDGLTLGRFTAFDDELAQLTRDGFQMGYRLSDLLYMIVALQDQTWQAITAEFLPERAVAYMQGLGNVLSTALTHVARVFYDEMQAGAAGELERAQWRLAQLDRAKSNFISIAAHELRTPITLIQGYSDILIHDFVDAADARAAAVANGLMTGARRLLQIVNDMIAVSMIDNESLALNFQPVSLLHVFQIVVGDLKNDIAERSIDVHVAPLPPEIAGRTLYADSQRLYDAFMHLVGNSIKYTPDGGHVRIETRLLSPGGGGEPVVQITVADDGIGIAPENRERIFEKFYGPTDALRHSSGRTKFKGGGPGLGLAVAKGVVEAHGGKIWVESPGYDEVKRPGTTVYVLLPMHTTPPAPRHRLNLDTDGG